MFQNNFIIFPRVCFKIILFLKQESGLEDRRARGSKVSDHLKSNKLLGNQQFGFRTLPSTALALSKCSSNWLLNMDRGDMTSVVFLDIRKAFDTVNHQILLDKLHCYGVGDEELLFFRSYLENLTQCAMPMDKYRLYRL